MKTSLLDKSVAIGVVSATYLALIVLWAPRLEGASQVDYLQRPAAPFTLEAEAGCAVQPPAPFQVPAPAKAPPPRGFWL